MQRPFKIQISAESIQLPKRKLELTRFPDELKDAGRDYGVPLADIQRLVTRWRDPYDWRKHEKQFKRDIQIDGFGTLGIHYIHKKSEVQDAIHRAWQFYRSQENLVKVLPDEPSFHVVALSLPG